MPAASQHLPGQKAVKPAIFIEGDISTAVTSNTAGIQLQWGTSMTISNFRKNCMGTLSFNGKFTGMRKKQDFIVYPLGSQSAATCITIQSDTRIGTIDLATGGIVLTPGISSGAYNHHAHLAKHAGDLSAEELLLLKSNILATASSKAGSCGVTCDNSAALKVLQ